MCPNILYKNRNFKWGVVMLFNILILSISLSIDALGIGTSYGMRKIRIPLTAKCIIALLSILFTGLSLYCGKWLSGVFTQSAAKFIGIGLLFCMGIWIIRQGFSEKQETADAAYSDRIEEKTMFQFIIKFLGITVQIIRTPQSCDMDRSNSIDPVEAFYLGLALSLDSLGAGLGSGASGIYSPAIPLLAALCQMLFLSLGRMIGVSIKPFPNAKYNVWTIVSGVLLIILGFIRFL